MAEKLRDLGVVPTRGSKESRICEVIREEMRLESRSFVDVAKLNPSRLGDSVWLELGESELQGRLEQLDHCLVDWWGNCSFPFPKLDYLRSWTYHHWLLKGRLSSAVLGRRLQLFEFELLIEAE